MSDIESRLAALESILLPQSVACPALPDLQRVFGGGGWFTTRMVHDSTDPELCAMFGGQTMHTIGRTLRRSCGPIYGAARLVLGAHNGQTRYRFVAVPISLPSLTITAAGPAAIGKSHILRRIAAALADEYRFDLDPDQVTLRVTAMRERSLGSNEHEWMTPEQARARRS